MSSHKVRANKPLLIMLYGFPGAGKTHFARNLTENLDAAHLQSDRIRNELFEEPRFDEQENNIVNQLMDYMCEEFLRAGISVIYDANAMRKTQRHAMRELVRKKGGKSLLVWFQIDADTAFNRLNKRDRRTVDDKYAVSYTQQDFRRYVSRMQQPQPTEDYVVVSGKHTYNSQKAAVFKKLLDMKLISFESAQANVVKPGLMNLIPNSNAGRVDMSRRNIHIR